VSTYSTDLRIQLIADSDQAGTWGQTTNTNLGTIIEQAIAGVSGGPATTGTYPAVNFPTDADITLTANNGTPDQARNAVLVVTSSVSLSAQRNVIAPAGASKVYIISNQTSGGQNIQIKYPTGGGVIIGNALNAIVYGDGTNFNLVSSGGSGGGANSGTQVNEFTATQGQTVFTTTFNYTPNLNQLAVFVNGSKQIVTTNYTETSNTTITFVTGLNVGDLVEIIYNQALSGGVISSQNITYTQGSTGSVTTNVQAKLQQTVSVKDFGAVGDGTTDDTTAIQNALNAGKNLYFPPGEYAVSSLNVPAAMIGRKIYGGGFSNYYPATQGTTILANTTSQAYIFNLNAGVDNVTFEGLRIDGNNKALIGINAISGFHNINRCGVYNTLNYGFYSTAGLNRISQCYFNNQGVGIQLYSDSAISDSEFTGGTIPISIVASGNRLSNVWANSGSVCCVQLSPLNSSTGLQNISITNLYAGETSNGTTTSLPIINILGLSSQIAQDIQITNSFIVCAALGVTPKINQGIAINYANDILISNVAFFGYGPYATTNQYVDGAINVTNSGNLNISNCSFKWINKNPIHVISGDSNVNISNCSFDTWGSVVATGDEYAAIRVESGYVNADGCSFVSADSNPYAVKTYQAYAVNFVGNNIRYPNATNINATSGKWSGIFQNAGSTLNIYNSAIQNSYIVPTSAPSSPVAGQLYYEISTNILYCWNGTMWKALF